MVGNSTVGSWDWKLPQGHVSESVAWDFDSCVCHLAMHIHSRWLFVAWVIMCRLQCVASMCDCFNRSGKRIPLCCDGDLGRIDVCGQWHSQLHPEAMLSRRQGLLCWNMDTMFAPLYRWHLAVCHSHKCSNRLWNQSGSTSCGICDRVVWSYDVERIDVCGQWHSQLHPEAMLSRRQSLLCWNMDTMFTPLYRWHLAVCHSHKCSNRLWNQSGSTSCGICDSVACSNVLGWCSICC
jgi:hypothetical protein